MAALEYVKLASVNVSPSDSPASLPASLFSVWLLFKVEGFRVIGLMGFKGLVLGVQAHVGTS